MRSTFTHRHVAALAAGVVMGGLLAVSGASAASAAPTTATVSTALTASCPRLGVYNSSNPDLDSDAVRQFGAAPQVANTYYQPTQRISMSKETARIQRGTSPNITITTKGTNYLEVLGTGPTHPNWATVSAWLNNHVNDLATLANVDPSVPVYATLDHEYKVKIRTGVITGLSADPLYYGRALNEFYTRAHAASSTLRTTYWIVGSDRVVEGNVATQFKTLPKAILFDPYANSTSSTVTSIASADLTWIRSQTWYTGQEIGLGEFGASVVYGDPALDAFFTDVRKQLAELGISWAVFFNRPRDLDTQIIDRADGQVFPKAVTRFSSALQAADSCGAPPPPPPPPPVPCPDLGATNNLDPDRDADVVRQFGSTPDVANSYYQPKQSVDVTRETARVKRGTSPNITFSTARTNYIEVLGTGPTHKNWKTVSNWLNNQVAALSTLANVNPDVPVYATLDHEFRSKVSTGQITGKSADPIMYGRALNRFYQLVEAKNAAVRTTYWFLGSDRAFEGSVAQQFTTLPDAVLFDPFAGVGADTLTSIASADVDWIKAQRWYDGQEIALGEFGARVDMGDVELADFYDDVPAELTQMGIAWAVFANRQSGRDTRIAERTDGLRFPQAQAAFTAAMADSTC